MTKRNLLPCDKEICPLNESAANQLGFLRLYGTNSEMGRRIITRLEQRGVDPDTIINCVRLDCHHLQEVHEQSAFAIDVINRAAASQRRGNKD